VAFSVPPERPVPGTIVAILRHAAEATRASGVVYCVGGALARDLLLFHVFGQRTGRATRDVDVMVFVEDWGAFEALKARLLATGEFTAADAAHRLLYGSMEVPLDLVPFGGVEGPAGTVAWPPERAVVMSVVGFREAAHTAIPIVVDEALTVPVVALAALSLLKLTAWLDRHQETDKDAIDLLTLLRLYHAAGNEDRLYGEETELLAACGFDPELAGARLLGRDAVRLCGGETVRGVLRRLPTALRRGLEDQMLRQAARFDDEPLQARLERLLAAFLDELAGAATGLNSN
jgi:predicted nucleotidyltransferase